MIKKVFITGGSSGIGKACCRVLSGQFEIFAPTRSQYDLSDFRCLDQYELSQYDIVINCAGSNVGTYQGFHQNDYINQSNQVSVNFVGALLMAKRYTQDRTHGQFIYLTSISADEPQVYNVFQAASKQALRCAMQTLAKKFTNIKFTEICPGRTRTNMLHQNYAGSKSHQEIEEEYNQIDCLTAEQVAQSVLYCIQNPIPYLKIVP